MNTNLLQIDVSDSKTNTNDLVEIKFGNNDIVQVNYYKLVCQSKYIRDNFSYSEALTSFQAEIDKIEDELRIDQEGIKLFFQLIQQEKISIPYEYFKDLYTLSNYFCIPQFTEKLDSIIKKELLNDLNFSIQNILDSKSAINNYETEFTSKIENFLGDRVNECLKNQKFGKLPISIIFRIISKSVEEKVNHNLLIDFILESVSTRFILLELVGLHKLTDEKIEKLFNFFDEQQEETRKLYFTYMQFNYSFIKKIKHECGHISKKLEQASDENEKDKKELQKTKEELESSKCKLEQTKSKLEKTESEFEKTKSKLEKTEIEFEKTKSKLEKTERESEQTRLKLEKIESEFKQTKEKIKQNEDELK